MSYRQHREAVFLRDGGFCQWCGQLLFLRDYEGGAVMPCTLDHIIPQALGGSHDPDNLLLSCAPCNSSRGRAMGILAPVLNAQKREAAREHREWVSKTGHQPSSAVHGIRFMTTRKERITLAYAKEAFEHKNKMNSAEHEAALRRGAEAWDTLRGKKPQ